MSWAIDQPHRSRWRRSEVVTPSGIRATVAPIGASMSGLLALLVGAWGAISVFVGPEFGYRPTTYSAWRWVPTNWLLHLAPGAVGLVAGLMVLDATRRRRSGAAGSLGPAALFLLAAGVWFVIGPVVWPSFESSPAFRLGVSDGMNIANVLGSSYGPGLLLCIFGGMALKAGIARPGVAVAEAATPEATADLEATASPGAVTGAETPSRGDREPSVVDVRDAPAVDDRRSVATPAGSMIDPDTGAIVADPDAGTIEP